MRHESTRTFYTLDGLRGIAAIAVFMHHAAPMWGPVLFPAGAYLAVDLFFLLSGFVLAHAYDRRFSSGMSVLGFLRVRLIRLYPIYLLACVLAVIVVVSSGALGFSNPCYGRPLPFAALFNMLFLPVPNRLAPGCDFFSLVIPAWSLFLELLINILFAVFWRHLSRRVLVATCVIAACAVVLSSAHYGSLDVGWETATLAGGPARVFFSFPLGVLLYRYARTWTVPHLSPWLVFVASMVALWTPAPDDFRPFFDAAAILFAFPAIVLVGSRSPATERQARIFLFFGAISYAIYLLHVPTFDLIDMALTVARHGFPAGHAIQTGLAPLTADHEAHLHLIARYAPFTGFAFLVALIVWCAAVDRYFDIPVRRWLSKLGFPRQPRGELQVD